MYYKYTIEDGGIGIVKANNKEHAHEKVWLAYTDHGGYERSAIEPDLWDYLWDMIEIEDLPQPFEDYPDVIEVVDE